MPRLERKVPGQPIRLSAGDWNAMLDLVRNDQARRLGAGGAGRGLSNTVSPTAVVLVSNATGSDVGQGYCLAITSTLLDPAGAPLDWLARPVLEGDEPVATTDPCVVLLEPIADGAIGRAAIAGLVIAQVDVTDTAHEYATPTAADATKLTSAASGPARLLWTETGSTGTQACVLSLLGGGSGGDNLTVKESDGSPSYTGITSLEFDQTSGFVVTQPGAGRAKISGGGITVEESDTSPSYPSTTTLEIDQAQGGVITQPGANRVKLSWASASLTTPGVVDTSAQTLAGAKSFKDFTTFHDEIVVGNGYTGATYPTLADPARLNLKETQLSPGGGLFSSQVMAYREDFAVPVAGNYNHVVATRIVSGSVYLQTLLKYNAETGVHTFELHRGAFTGSAVSGSATTCAYAIDGLLGGTATLGGMEFTGGIYTDGTLTVDLTSEVTGALPTGNGGIGLTTTPPAGSVLAGDGSGYVQTPVVVMSYMWGTD